MPARAKQAATLSEYAGKKVSVICAACEILRHFEGEGLLAEHGDVSMPGLLEVISKLVGCERSTTGFYNRCTLTYYFSHREWCERSGCVTREEYQIALGKRLADLKEWETLNARCRCGRHGRLNRKSLERRYGPQSRIRELAAKLLCQECKKYDSVIEISSLPR